MKKTIKSLFCIMLSVIMVFSTTVIAFAKDDVTPVILVHGFIGVDLYKNPGTSDQAELIDTGSLVLSLLGENRDAVLSIRDAATGKLKDKKKFLKDVAKLMGQFSDLACDKDGNPVANVGVADYWYDNMENHKDYLDKSTSTQPALTKTICEQIGAKNVYCFNYDFRLDVYDNAQDLDKYIDNVKKLTGKDKVTLVGSSEGAAVLSAYIDSHKDDNEIEKLVFINGALEGVSVTNLFTMDLKVSKKILKSYFEELMNTYKNASFDMQSISWITDTADDTFGNIADLLTDIMADKELREMLYLDVLYPIMGCMPCFWEFIEYDKFDDAVKKMSDIGFLDKTGGLYTKITRYHAVQGRVRDNIKYMKKNGVQVAIIANYGTPVIPLTSEYKNQSDILIDTKYASAGATVANYGKTLSNKVTSKSKYASPDEIINAATCTLPDNTWFVKGVTHVDFWYGTDAVKFVSTIITTTTPTNIKSIKKKYGYQQFIGTGENQKIVKIAPNVKKASIKKATASKKSIKLALKKINGVKGYQIQYSTSPKFTKKTTKSVTLKGNTKTATTLKKLKKGTEYYVRVRSYKTIAKKTAYSSWTDAKTVTTK